MNSVTLLKSFIDDFAEGRMEAEVFEKSFNEIYDFVHFEDSLDEQSKTCLKQMREALERFTAEEKDIREYPNYYMNGHTLRKIILECRPKLIHI